jgi:hypothetical protein
MAHFARLKNNIVYDVIVISNDDIIDNGKESEQKGIEFCKSLWGDAFEYLQTSYNNKIRKNYAAPSYTYNKELDAFIPPKPKGDFVLNKETCNWELIEM